MPTFQSITLTDRATPTPVNYTFTPATRENGVAVVTHAPNGVELGAKKLSISTRKSAGKTKTRFVLALPVVQTETINGISRPVVVRDMFFDLTVTSSASSTEAERNDAVGMFASMFATGKLLVHDTLVKGENVYG